MRDKPDLNRRELTATAHRLPLDSVMLGIPLVVPDARLQLFIDSLTGALGVHHDLLTDRFAHVFRHQVFPRCTRASTTNRVPAKRSCAFVPESNSSRRNSTGIGPSAASAINLRRLTSE
jgi:hypothetical protein